MSKQIDKQKVKARELTDYYYFTTMMPDDWSVTPSTYQFSRYDAIASNGERVIYTELKGRDIPLTDEIKEEGAYIECSKADYLYKFKDAAIVQFFWKSNVTYVWNIKDRDKWEKVYKLMDNNNEDKEDVYKWVYLLPFDEKNARYTVNLTNYHELFVQNYKQLTGKQI